MKVGQPQPARAWAMHGVLASLVLAAFCGCGSGGGAEGAGKSAPTYPIEVRIGGLDEGYVALSNGLDTFQIDADPDGLAADKTVTLDTELPAGVGYDVRIVNDPMAQFALQCDVVGGQGTMPAHVLNTVLVRCARVKSVRRLAGVLPLDVVSRDGLAADARFQSPGGVVEDKSRNVYVADTLNHTIRRITPAGVVSTFAGSAGSAGASDGKGPDARFNEPRGIAIDVQGNLHVADTGNSAIRRITPDGVVSTLVVKEAALLHPHGVAVDTEGNVYVADTGADLVRRIASDGSALTLAPGTTFHGPQGIAVDSAGLVYVADTDSTPSAIRRIAKDGSVATLVNSGLDHPCCIALDAMGNVLIADTFNNAIQVLTTAGDLQWLAGGAVRRGQDDGVGRDARFHLPQGIGVDARGNAYVADTNGQTIRLVTTAGVTSTIAGRSTTAGYKDGPAADGQFSEPAGVAADADGSVYVADTGNNTVRHISRDGVVSTFMGSATDPPGVGGDTLATVRLKLPRGVAVDGKGGLYVADTDNDRVLHVAKDGVLSILHGIPFDRPRGLAVDVRGVLYVADMGNHLIRRIENGKLTGTYTHDDALNEVDGIAIDSVGNLFVSNSNETFSTIVRISATGEVKTIAGVERETGPFVDEVDDSTKARLYAPSGLAVDSGGNLYVADSKHRAIRVLNAMPDGSYQVRTVTGGPSTLLTRLGPVPQPIGIPLGLAITGKRLYVTTGDAILFIDR